MQDRMLEENNAAWMKPPAPRTDLESSLHKISGYFNKLRTVNASNSEDLEKDALKLRLEKYPTELGESLGIAASKLSKIIDIKAFADFVGFLHRILGPPFTTVVIPKIVKSVDSTGKVRTTLRVSLDLYIAGLLRDISTVEAALKPVLDPTKSPPHATIKLLSGYRDDLKANFSTVLNNYAERLEDTLEASPKERDPLLLSEELQRIDEQNRERKENIKAYLQLCAILDRTVDSRLGKCIRLEGGDDDPTDAITNTSSAAAIAAPFNPPTPVVSRPSTPSAPKWSAYEHKLISMSTTDQVRAVAKSFPQDSTIIKKAQSLLVEKPKAHMLPNYALFLSLSPLVADKVVPEVLKRAQDTQTYLKYTAELVKFGVIPPHGAVDVIIKLTRPQLNAQQVYTFAEACGQFMVENELISHRVSEYTDFLRRQPASTPLERQLIDGTISYLLPVNATEEGCNMKSTATNLSSFVELLIYRELQKKTYKSVLKILMKLKPGELCSLVPLFTNCSTTLGDNIPRIAQLVGALSLACTRFGYQVLDDAVERFYTDLKSDNRQSLVAQAMLLGNLQAQELIGYNLTVSILKRILEFSKDKFRLKLACFFISSTDASDFNVQEFLDALEEYKSSTAIDMDLLPIYNSAISHLQLHESPKVESFEEEEEEEKEDEEEEEEEEEIPLEDDVDDLEDLVEDEFSDEDFEREFSEMVGDSKPALNEVTPPKTPVKPLDLSLTALKIAKR